MQIIKKQFLPNSNTTVSFRMVESLKGSEFSNVVMLLKQVHLRLSLFWRVP